MGTKRQVRYTSMFDQLPGFLFERHRSEQYFTSSQTRSHFFRQEKGRLHVSHTLLGSVAFVNRLAILPVIGPSRSGQRAD